MKLPLIVDIKRHSLEDGPGIRSVVFFKGCPLRCVFCHNPEAQDPAVEIAYSAKDCIKCGRCREVCPQNAIDMESEGHILRDICDRCGRCADSCPGNGLKSIGRYYTVDELAEILLRDVPFYRRSGGGITLSGGECAIYPDYLESLLKRLKADNLHTAIETSGFFEYSVFERQILPYIDLIFYDVKIADPALHERFTGRNNSRILNNLQRLLIEKGGSVIPRIPLIPDITATSENLSDIVDFLCEAGADSISLNLYNPMGAQMNVNLGRKKPPLPEGFMQPEEEKRIYETLGRIIKEKRAAFQLQSVHKAEGLSLTMTSRN